MNTEGIKKVCVAGWGKSGIALADLLFKLKKQVKVTEAKTKEIYFANNPAGVDSLKHYESKGAAFEFGGHTKEFISGCQLMVISPGVDTFKSEAVKIANDLKIPVVGEIEFASWFTQSKIVAVTGTNGKTTTTYLIHKILQENGKRAFLGGNIGIPFASFVLETKKRDIIVLEVSSFQMETIIEFKPYVACLTNLDLNHLDRYDKFEDYVAAKMNMFRNQKPGDFAVVNKNLQKDSKVVGKVPSKIRYFSKEFTNENYSCAYRAASLFGLTKAECKKVLDNFEGLPHRLQVVRRVNNVAFVNDSKATTPGSTVWALKNIHTPVVLIAGGKDKGVDYAIIAPYLKKVKKINLIGAAAQKIKDALAPYMDATIYGTFEEVVRESFTQARPGDTVLLSPMCASFDMFNDYIHRGERFIEEVNKL